MIECYGFFGFLTCRVCHLKNILLFKSAYPRYKLTYKKELLSKETSCHPKEAKNRIGSLFIFYILAKAQEILAGHVTSSN